MGLLEGMGTGAAGQIVGQGLGMIFGKANDDRQAEQAQRLQDIQVGGMKNMADYNANIAKNMWDYTNVENQVKHMDNAGLSVGLMYRGVGAGGATTSAGGGGSGVAAATPADPNARTGLGMQLGAQLALMDAQRENIQADTANKKAIAEKTAGIDTTEAQARTAKTGAETTNQEFNNKVNELTGAQQIADRYHDASDQIKIASEKANAEWESYKAAGFPEGKYDDPNSPVAKATRAGLDKTIQDLQNAKTTNNIARAEQTIKEFQANLAKQGISPDTPWYVKIVADLLDKVGMSPIKAIKNAM